MASSKMLNALGSVPTARTENGAVTYSSSGSANTDMFALVGSMRARKDEALRLFTSALAEDEVLGVLNAIHLRNIRGGNGERDLARAMFNWLAINRPETFSKVFKYIPDFGRWDDLMSMEILESPLGRSVSNWIKRQLMLDINHDKPSLLAKWMPSINTSSKESRKLANYFAQLFEMSPRKYRKTLADIRAKLNVLEVKMSARKWTAIDYSKIPSRASKIYSKAFAKRDAERYAAFWAKVEKGEAKVNTGTLYPYELLVDILKADVNGDRARKQLMWDNLPDYAGGKNSLVVVDTSGSMGSVDHVWNSQVQPIHVALSLGLYFAERNTGYFKDHFLTFSNSSDLVKIRGNGVYEKVHNMAKAKWEMSTNLQAAFDHILKAAIDNNLTQDDMPDSLIIVSDMEFNSAGANTNLKTAKDKYAARGYVLPKVVFWNVAARNTQVPALASETSVNLVSGLSSSNFKWIADLGSKTPEDYMKDVLFSEMYAEVKKALVS